MLCTPNVLVGNIGGHLAPASLDRATSARAGQTRIGPARGGPPASRGREAR